MTIFISRAGEDSAAAQQIAAILQAEGHTVIIQDADFAAGSFPHHIKQAIDAADRFIAIYSPRYFDKPFCLAELYAAFARDPIGDLRFLIPVLVAPCTVPYLFQPFIYLDFVAIQDEAPRQQSLRSALASGRPAPQPHEIRTSIQHLPSVNPTLFGRQAELDKLEQAFTTPDTNLLQIIAPGGTGKTALMTSWYRRHGADVTIFGWSFYSQGTGEKSQTSAEPFFNEALPWFGIAVAPTESIFRKVDLLVDRLRHERVLLILDGVEPLQDPNGALRDKPLLALLQELAVRNPGLVLVTTRVRLTDVPDDPPHAISIDLENLAPEDGARYLAHLGVNGDEGELRAASAEYWNHALALTLLGTYLTDFCGADIRRRNEIPKLADEDSHAHRVIKAYERTFAGKPELDVLRALGYFDRPAEPDALSLVLPPMDGHQYQAALNRLHKARLILSTNPKHPIDCHPLIREHFGTQATRDGHARLYEHYKTQAPHRPDTLEAMTPLFYAVYHGCQAGRHQEALDDVYFERIHHGEGLYLYKKLGAFGTNLSLLASFFEVRWNRPVATISASDKSWLIGEAGFSLSALGRLPEAVDVIRSAVEAYVKAKDWKNASTGHGNLTALLLTLGNISEAVATARQAIDFADRSGDSFQREDRRAYLANALHQSGDSVEASRVFEEAERLKMESTPNSPLLSSDVGYYYCDLLLSQRQTTEVLRRASKTLLIANQQFGPLDIGLDHLSLGRAHPASSPEALHHLNQAVDFIRRSGNLHNLPLALLARATPSDLAEAFRIASRSGMRLYLADYHLISARQALAANLHPLALHHFQKAEALIAETGYHRRDSELAALRSQLQSRQP